MSKARKTVTLDGPFRMHRGGCIQSPTLAYETWGELDAERSNAILVFSGLSPSAHAASSSEDQSPGWWEDMIGSGLPLDSDRFFIICVNSLGSCFGSTGPASVDPVTGKPYRLDFPVLTLEDVAEGAWGVVQHLGIDKLHAVVGCSMGGMSGLAYCVRHPGSTSAFVSISSATRAEPFSIAVRSLQREMIRSDPKWQDGNYAESDPPLSGRVRPVRSRRVRRFADRRFQALKAGSCAGDRCTHRYSVPDPSTGRIGSRSSKGLF